MSTSGESATASEPQVAAEPVAPPVSDMSGVRIEQPQADSPEGRTARSDTATTGERGPGEQGEAGDEREEGAVSRFFKSLLGRKS